MGATSNFVFSDVARRGPAALIAGGNRLAARKWYRENARAIRNVNTARLMTSDPKRLISSLRIGDIGKMLMYYYDPKWKKRLPYYDMFPLIFVIDVQPGHFMGINLHYLHPLLRAKLMDALYTTISDDRYDDRTKLRINYGILNGTKRYRWFKPCIKKYLWGHVRSRFFHIEPEDWDTTLMLPLERFEKATKTQVWTESSTKIR